MQIFDINNINNNSICGLIINKLTFIKKWVYYILYVCYCWLSKFYKRRKKSDILIYKSYVYGQLISVISAGMWWGFFGTTVTLLMDSKIATGLSRLIFNVMFIIMSPLSGSFTLILGMKNILMYANTLRMFIWCTFCPIIYFTGIVYKYSKIKDIIGFPLFYILVGVDGILVSLINVNDLDCGGLNIISYENKIEVTDTQKSQVIYTYLNLFDLTFIFLNPLISIFIFLTVYWYYKYNTSATKSEFDNNNNGVGIPILILLTLYQIFTFSSIIFYRFGIPPKKSYKASNFSCSDENLSKFEVGFEDEEDFDDCKRNVEYRDIESCETDNHCSGNTRLGNFYNEIEGECEYDSRYNEVGNGRSVESVNEDEDEYFSSDDGENLNSIDKKAKFDVKRSKLKDEITFMLVKSKIIGLIQDIKEIKCNKNQVFRALSLAFETGMEDAMMTSIIPLFTINLSEKLTIFDEFIISSGKPIKCNAFGNTFEGNNKKIYLASISLLIVSFIFSIGKLITFIIKLNFKKELLINHNFNINTDKRSNNISFNGNFELNKSLNECEDNDIDVNFEPKYEVESKVDNHLQFNVQNKFDIAKSIDYSHFRKDGESQSFVISDESILCKINKLFTYYLIGNLTVIILPITLTAFNYNYSATNKKSNNMIQVITIIILMLFSALFFGCYSLTKIGLGTIQQYITDDEFNQGKISTLNGIIITLIDGVLVTIISFILHFSSIYITFEFGMYIIAILYLIHAIFEYKFACNCRINLIRNSFSNDIDDARYKSIK